MERVVFFCQKSAWWWVSTCLAVCWRLVTDHELDHWIILFLPGQADLFSVGCILWHGEKEMRRAHPLAFVRTGSLFMSHKVKTIKYRWLTVSTKQCTMYPLKIGHWVSSPNALLSNLSNLRHWLLTGHAPKAKEAWNFWKVQGLHSKHLLDRDELCLHAGSSFQVTIGNIWNEWTNEVDL